MGMYDKLGMINLRYAEELFGVATLYTWRIRGDPAREALEVDMCMSCHLGPNSAASRQGRQFRDLGLYSSDKIDAYGVIKTGCFTYVACF